MGIIHNHVILATTLFEKEIDRIEEWVSELEGDPVLGAPPQTVFLFTRPDAYNQYRTVIMLPDGSKENWEPSDWYNDLRDRFIQELEKSVNDDGSSPWNWVEVAYGDRGQSIVRGNNKDELL